MRILALAILAAVVTLSQPATTIRAATVFTVNSIADSTDGVCSSDPGGCTLREAIEAANANLNPAEQDIIAFNIPGDGVQIIRVGSGNRPGQSLPSITEPVLIDGTTQPGASCSPRNVLIEVNGSSTPGNADGIAFVGGPSIVRAVSVLTFKRNVVLGGQGKHRVECANVGTPAHQLFDDSLLGTVGIEILSNENTVGGFETRQRNVVRSAIGIRLTLGNRNVIANNSFVAPASPADTSRSHVEAISIDGLTNTISSNVFDGWGTAIAVHSGGATTITNNIVGVSLAPDGSPSNDTGITFLSGAGGEIRSNFISRNGIGVATDTMSTLIYDNTISQHSITGILLKGNTAYTSVFDNDITGNQIGVDVIAPHTGSNSIVRNYIGNVNSYGPVPGFPESIGIRVTGPTWFGTLVIGHDIDGSRNVISGNGKAGIELNSVGRVQISGNRIGTDTEGMTAIPNGIGIYQTGKINTFNSDDNWIGANLISGNRDAGIVLDDTSRVTIIRNLIGPNANGGYMGFNRRLQPVGLQVSGIRFDIRENVILRNAGPGIFAPSPGIDDSEIRLNIIEQNAGAGIDLRQASDVIVANNNIAGNDGNGLSLEEGSAVQITQNSFAYNRDIGIDLGRDGISYNDLGDYDLGPNQLLNFPELRWTRWSDGHIRVIGRVETHPLLKVSVELFLNQGCGDFYYGEGETYLGTIQVQTDVEGKATFDSLIPSEDADFRYLTATATANLATGFAAPIVSTSEFSQCTWVGFSDGPEIAGLWPPSVQANQQLFVLRVDGEHIAEGTVLWNGLPLATTTSVSDEGVPYLEATVPEQLLTSPGEAEITVQPQNSTPSNPLSFHIRASSSSDANCSGGVDAADALFLLATLAGFAANECGQYDANSDGELTLADVLYIRKVAAGLLPR